jgi:hypothetical protein
MPRKPVDTAHINLRIRESLRRKLEREAKAHRTSLNNEIRLRLEDSLEKGAARDLDGIAADMKNVWARYSERFLLLDLEEQLARALAKTNDSEVAKFATVWLHTRQTARKNKEGVS